MSPLFSIKTFIPLSVMSDTLRSHLLDPGFPTSGGRGRGPPAPARNWARRREVSLHAERLNHPETMPRTPAVEKLFQETSPGAVVLDDAQRLFSLKTSS